ncbi:MAG: 23S rRNA (pseudouridine(1915)-N(3))-methyltransferase RlmH [Bacillota bacterium]
MRIDVVAVGKMKERFLAEAVRDYERRISRYCRIEIREVAESPFAESDGEARKSQLRAGEAARLISRIRPGSYVIACDLAGKEMTSEQFAQVISDLGVAGVSDLTFVIGGPLGYSPEVLAGANQRIAFSKMTFPHQLMRVILLEQIYRAFKIARNEPYHH